MSSTDFTARVRGPRIELTTALAKDDDVLVIGLYSADGDDAAPVLDVPADFLDDATAEALTTALSAVDATGKSGELTTVPAPAGRW